MITKPNFFIVGTPKSGTTSLFNYLEDHPEVFVPKIKEPHFFSYPEIVSTYYKTTIINSQESYNNLYKHANGYQAVGDLSSSYLFNSQSAIRIKEFNPEAKIIVVLRNPVDRAVSHYLMDYNLNYIQKPLLEVLRNKEQNNKFYTQYVELGFYEKQLKPYFDVFHPDKVLILLSDELFSNTEKTVSRIFGFIDVDPTFIPDFSKKYNQFKEPRFKIVTSLKRSRKIKWIFKLLPGRLKNWTTNIAFDSSKVKPSFEEEIELLQKLYESAIERTEALINKDLSSWKRN